MIINNCFNINKKPLLKLEVIMLMLSSGGRGNAHLQPCSVQAPVRGLDDRIVRLASAIAAASQNRV